MSAHVPTIFAARSAVAWDADEVEHRVGAVAASCIADGFDGGGIRLECRMRSDLASECELVLADIDRDDAGRRQSPEHLDGEVAEATDADDDGGRTRDELWQRWLDRVIRRQPRVRQRHVPDRIEISERDEVPRTRDDLVLGHGPGRTQAGRPDPQTFGREKELSPPTAHRLQLPQPQAP